MKLYKELEEVKPYLEGKPSEEKCIFLEDAVKLLWQKIIAYEHHGHSERRSRNKAVDELSKAKKFISDGEGEKLEKPDQVWKTLWKESDGTKTVQSGWVDKEEVPKVMVMRAQPLEELEDPRVMDIQQ